MGNSLCDANELLGSLGDGDSGEGPRPFVEVEGSGAKGSYVCRRGDSLGALPLTCTADDMAGGAAGVRQGVGSGRAGEGCSSGAAGVARGSWGRAAVGRASQKRWRVRAAFVRRFPRWVAAAEVRAPGVAGSLGTGRRRVSARLGRFGACGWTSVRTCLSVRAVAGGPSAVCERERAIGRAGAVSAGGTGTARERACEKMAGLA